MVEVTGGTSSGSVLSDTQGKSDEQKHFDLRSWQGLTEVLQAARSAGLSDQAYAGFRDAVLEYAQSGGNRDLKQKIDATIATFGSRGKSETATSSTEPQKKKRKRRRRSSKKNSSQDVENDQLKMSGTSPATPMQPSSRSVFGVRRGIPTFGVSKNDSAKHEVKAEPVQVVQEPEPAIERMPQTKERESYFPDNLPVENVSKVSDEKLNKQEVVLPSLDKNAEEHISTVQEEPEQHQPAIDTPPPQEESKPEPPRLNQSLDAYKARIAEIKHEVNTKIGNPVTLIDSGNDIGKQYMNALLLAMKATNGGSKES